MNSSSNALRRDDADARFDGSLDGSFASSVDSNPAPSPARQRDTLITVDVWDPALRLFHWLLAAAVAAAVVSGEIGGPWIEWHGRAGEAIAGLLAFRLAWGLIGPATARFTSFVRGPTAIIDYLRGKWQGIGHNPLGALAVLALLLLGALQVASGLFANDDIAFQGPLAVLVSSHWSDRASGLHQKLSWLLIGMVGIHLLAIAWYRLVRKDDLVGPMLHGQRSVAPEQLAALAPPSSKVSATLRWGALRLLFAAGFGVVTAALVSGQFLPSQLPTSNTISSTPAVQAQAPARPAW